MRNVEGSTAPKKSNKRARLAVVRTGCIQARRRSDNSTKPGPVTSPGSSSQQKKIVSQSKKKVKLVAKLTLAACTWRTSNQGGKRVRNIDYTCCGRLDCYREYRKAAGGTSEQLAATISSMRKYYHSLPSDGKREWWADHVEYAGYARGQTPVAFRKHVRLSTFLCEPYAELTAKLADTSIRDKLQPMNPHTALTVCSKFIQFLFFLQFCSFLV